METSAKKATVVIVILCLIVGSIVFFGIAPGITPEPVVASPQKSPLSTGSNHIDEAPNTAMDASAAAVRAMPQLPARPPTDDAPSRTGVEIDLPSPPSGDYELNLTNEQINAIVETRYGGLFRTLELTPAQLARLRSLLGERQQATVDAANAALINGLNPVRDLPTIHRIIEQVQAASDLNLRNEMGDSVFTAYRDFDRTLGERNAVRDFARVLAATHEPLRPEQEKVMVQILKNFPGKDQPADIDRTIFDSIKSRAPISDQALAAAATVLSPQQLELLHRLQKQTGHSD